MAAALLGVDHQRAVALEDRRVRVPLQIGAQRFIRQLSVRGLDDQCARLPVIVEHRLGDAATGGAAQQPLQFPR